MNTKQNTGREIRNVLLFYILCFAIRTAESLFIRTDRSVFGELFIHKLIGIALLGAAIGFLRMKWADIGFDRAGFARGILTGVSLGLPAYAVAYLAEFAIQARAGENPALSFFATSYGVTGNTEMQSGFLFILICIAGNIVNVIMEEGVFRGLFMTALNKRLPAAGAILLSSVLFGLWHIVEPFRNFIDGEQSPAGASMMALMLFAASTVFGIALCLLFRVTGSLWAGMVLHFMNNAGANLLHVVSSSGTDGLQTMRIAIAQTLLFAAIAIWYAMRFSKRAKEAQG
ncbi:MAG TPA: CPBP family intramembrane glutamic endopeptidase [Candidatus Acidoferrum sp.]|nr:CPBP family intramembrane glutamic endopeptidase [Candidatus Acidoferrum sp.]